jgi:hypothetical protein
MIAFIEELFTILNTVSPLAIIGLLGTIIYLLVWRGGGLHKLKCNQEELADNHLHDVCEGLTRIEKAVLALGLNIDQTRHEIVRNQTEIQKTLAWLQAKSNGHPVVTIGK